MPPIRNVPMSIKPVKTERTHEENQERAYIAASRRSDRSLEARIESARRASEIHKRRTGRSLRVREEDVINEEMYEEEDDDLPQQYRRLTAHLATSNTEFDRRLRAYITNQVAMRSVFGQAAVGNWQGADQNFPSTAHFLPPGLLPTAPQLPLSANSMPSPAAFTQQSPATSYRQTPYSTQPNNLARMHHRSQSAVSPSQISTTQLPRQSHSTDTSPVEHKSLLERRTSMPAHGAQAPPFSLQQMAPPTTTVPSPAVSTGTGTDSPHNTSTPQPQYGSSTTQQQQQQQATPQQLSAASMTGTLLDPLSATLPFESQQLLAGGPFFNFHDPFASLLDSDVDLKHPQPMYSYNPNAKGRSDSFDPHDKASAGLNQTLWGGPVYGQGGGGDDAFFGVMPTSVNPLALDGTFKLDPSNLAGQGYNSVGNPPTHVKEEWESFLQGDAFDEQSAPFADCVMPTN